MKILQFFCIILIFCALSACGRSTPRGADIVIPEPLEEIQTVAAPEPEKGSLWSSTNGSMFSDRKAQNVGDLVTVIIKESSSANKKASTDTSRDSSMSAGIPNFFGLESASIISQNNLDLNNLVNAKMGNEFEGSGTTSRNDTLTASLSTQVIARYPNGQLKIRGGKEVMVNNEVQIIYLTGIIRPVDITADNTVLSDKILNARISYTGKGVLSDKQEPGWLTRSLDHVWPF